MRRKLGLGLLFVVGGLLGLVGYQAIAVQREGVRFPPPGKLVDVGGYKLHLHCVGAGSPTLVMDSGAGNWSIFWGEVQKALGSTHRVCAFDRAGYGWSEPSPHPRTSRDMTNELRTLLQNAGLKPPFVLVGHSLGGYNARVYRNLYPEEVVAMVLVDSAHPEQWTRLPKQVSLGLQQQVRTLKQAAVLSQLGVLRMLQNQLPQFNLPVEQRTRYTAAMMRPQTYRTFAAEAESAATSALQVAQTKPLSRLPLLVLTAGSSFDAFRALIPELPIAQSNQVWLELQAELATLSHNSSHQISQKAGHYLMVDEPDFVSQAIGQFLAQKVTSTKQ